MIYLGEHYLQLGQEYHQLGQLISPTQSFWDQNKKYIGLLIILIGGIILISNIQSGSK